MKITITAVLAMTDSGLIGSRNGLPWNLPEDMKHFKEITKGGVVIMGKNTYLSLPEKFRPLPGRRNIVLSRNVIDDVECFTDIHVLIDSLSREGVAGAFVIGGAQIYDAFFAQGFVDRVELTLVDGSYQGDVYVQEFRDSFHEVAHEEREGLSFVTLERNK